MSTKSSKNELQEFCDGMRWEHPRYENIGESPLFSVRVEVRRGNQDTVSAVGEHTRKKEAGKIAARILLDKLMSGSLGEEQMHEEGASLSDQISEAYQQGASPQVSPWGSRSPKSTKSFINYRAHLNQYCQQNSLTLSYDDMDNLQSLRRFSTKVTIEGSPAPAIGSGDSKKEANEEAAMQMWNSLKLQENKSSSTTTTSYDDNPPKILYKDPLIGLQQFGSLPLLNLNDSNASIFQNEFDPNSPSNLNNLNIDSDNENDKDNGNNENSASIDRDYVGTLTDNFKNTEMDINFVPIPFETQKVDEHFYFVSVGVQGDVPLVAGHGKGSSEEEAKNAAAKDCLELCVDAESTKLFNDVIDKTNLNS